MTLLNKLLIAIFLIVAITNPIQAEGEWIESCSVTAFQNINIACGNYTITSIQFAAPIPAHRTFKGDLVLDKPAQPSIFFKAIYKDMTESILLTESELEYTNNSFKVRVSDFSDKNSLVWSEEKYNPQAKLHFYYKNETKANNASLINNTSPTPTPTTTSTPFSEKNILFFKYINPRIYAGNNVTVVITISNSGNYALENVRVTDTLEDGFLNINQQSLSWTFPKIKAYSQETILYKAMPLLENMTHKTVPAKLKYSFNGAEHQKESDTQEIVILKDYSKKSMPLPTKTLIYSTPTTTQPSKTNIKENPRIEKKVEELPKSPTPSPTPEPVATKKSPEFRGVGIIGFLLAFLLFKKIGIS